MKAIYEVLSFIGLSTLITAIILYVLNQESSATILGVVSLISFAAILFFHLYKLYVLIKMKNVDPE